MRTGEGEGETEAAVSLDALIASFRPAALAKARFLTRGSRLDPEDLCHAAILATLLRADGIRNPDAARAYLLQAVRTQWINYLRRAALSDRERRGGLRLSLSTSRQPDESLIEDLERQLARRAFDALSKAEQAVLRLRIIDGLPHADVALKLGISEEAARQRLTRARKRLADIYEELENAKLSQLRPPSPVEKVATIRAGDSLNRPSEDVDIRARSAGIGQPWGGRENGNQVTGRLVAPSGNLEPE